MSEIKSLVQYRKKLEDINTHKAFCHPGRTYFPMPDDLSSEISSFLVTLPSKFSPRDDRERSSEADELERMKNLNIQLETWIHQRKINHYVLRTLLNVVTIVLTGGAFHLMYALGHFAVNVVKYIDNYLVATPTDLKFSLDWTLKIEEFKQSRDLIKKVESFVEDSQAYMKTLDPNSLEGAAVEVELEGAISFDEGNDPGIGIMFQEPEFVLKSRENTRKHPFWQRNDGRQANSKLSFPFLK